MGLTIRQAKEEEHDVWDTVVTASPHGILFHTWDWLKITEKYSDSVLHPLMVFHDTNLIAIYPLYFKKIGPFHAVFSPPPNAYMLYLGPVIVDYENKKMNKKESLFWELQKEVDRYVFERHNGKVCRIRLNPGLYDFRPLSWCDYNINPCYTYQIPLIKGPEFIWNQFDRKLRVGINRAIREGIEIVDGDKRDISSIEDELARRRREQGLFSMNHTQYIVDLYDKFPENMKIFLAYHGGDLVGSMITLLHKKRMRVWVGTPKTAFKGPSANDYIQWRAIEWACGQGYEYFENMDGGNDMRLTSYKSKFNPELATWFSATKYASPAYQFGRVMARYLIKKAKNFQTKH